MIKIQTLVALVVFTLGFSLRAGAQAYEVDSNKKLWGDNCSPIPKNGYTKDSCQELKSTAYPTTGGVNCDSEQKDYLTAFAKIKTIPSEKVDYYRNCLAGEASEGRDAMYGAGSDTEDEKCEAVSKAGCAELEERGRKDGLEDAQENFTKARQAVIDLEQNSKNQQKALKRKAAAIKLDQEAGIKSYQLQIDATTKELDAAMKAQDQDLRKKMAELRKQLTAKTSALSALNDGLRGAEMAVASAKFSWEASCRTEAFQKLEVVKAEIKKTKEEQVKSKMKINYAGSNVAGAKNRREAKERLKQQAEYVTGYKTCLAGASGAGAAAKLKESEAIKALEMAKLSASEKRATIEQEIKDLTADFAADETANAENKDTVRKQIESKIAAANLAYETSVKKSEQLLKELEEDYNDAMAMAAKQGELALETANTAQMALATAKLRDECGGGAGSTSTQAARLTERYQSVVDADDSRSALCTSYEAASSACPKISQLCKDHESARGPKDDDDAPAARTKVSK
ncbi:MAG: hypothetical protein EOP06_13495 [Proteobacteria bacterium]|nr:MAG: hypothetical protein EOP06_13495 [Pseudomonadota bacterium]